jgi:hypothetical protein
VPPRGQSSMSQVDTFTVGLINMRPANCAPEDIFPDGRLPGTLESYGQLSWHHQSRVTAQAFTDCVRTVSITGHI